MREFKPLLGIDGINKTRLINVGVHTKDGKETIITVCPGDHVASIKEKLLGEACAKDVLSYKVIALSNMKVLEDQHTIEQEGIIENDQFLVCQKRRNFTNQCRKSISFSSKGPDLQIIKNLSEHLGEEKGTSATSPGLGHAGMFDFFGELKRILVSLTEVASLVQHVNSEENNESDDMETDEVDIHIDSLCLKKLTDMGFDDQRSRKALIICKMSPVQAMEWLLQHEGDKDIDTPLSQEELRAYSGTEVHSKKRKRTAGKRKEFVPSPRAVMNLKEMGFEEKDIVQALKYFGNNQERALDWLLGDRQPINQNPDGGLDPNSPLYTAIMDHPVVQLGLTNPRILHAFEDMLDNPSNSGQYINDPEIGPVLLQISRIVQSFSR